MRLKYPRRDQDSSLIALSAGVLVPVAYSTPIAREDRETPTRAGQESVLPRCFTCWNDGGSGDGNRTRMTAGRKVSHVGFTCGTSFSMFRPDQRPADTPIPLESQPVGHGISHGIEPCPKRTFVGPYQPLCPAVPALVAVGA